MTVPSRRVVRRVAAGETPGDPRFHGAGRYTSCTVPDYGHGAVLDGRILSLAQIGRGRMRGHRPLVGTPKTVTISRAAEGWYACIAWADGPTEPVPLTGQETGIDVGLQVLLITADGAVVENPRHHRTAQRRLARAQRRVSRRKQGSHRRRKAVAWLKRKHQTVQRQRRDVHHKAALDLVRHYDTISREDLAVRNLRRRPEPKPKPDEHGTGG